VLPDTLAADATPVRAKKVSVEFMASMNEFLPEDAAAEFLMSTTTRPLAEGAVNFNQHEIVSGAAVIADDASVRRSPVELANVRAITCR
jgi:hypothetical protein